MSRTHRLSLSLKHSGVELNRTNFKHILKNYKITLSATSLYFLSKGRTTSDGYNHSLKASILLTCTCKTFLIAPQTDDDTAWV